MEPNEQQAIDRLERAATLLERALAELEERAGEVERISATVELSRREQEAAEKLAAAQQEIAELKAAASATQALAAPQATTSAVNPLRRTVPASTTEMLAKHGIGEGPVEVRALDAALVGLSLEQRIAVKSQLLRAGALAQG